MANYTTKEILEDLDSSSDYKAFLDLDHGYEYTLDSRVSLFADEDRWGIAFENAAFNPRAGATILTVSYFGNCLTNLDKAGLNDIYTSNSKIFYIIEPDELSRIEKDFELVSPDIKSVKIRESDCPIIWNLERLNAIGVELQDYDNPDKLLDFVSLNRLMCENHNDLFKARMEELKTCLPDDIPFIMNIDEWHHEPYQVMLGFPEAFGTKPSEQESYKLIAEILINYSPKLWKPTLEPNNHWTNWPNAGTM